MITSRFNYGKVLTPERVNGNNREHVRVGVIMGSQSDWSTVESCCQTLDSLQIPFEYGVVSAHRTPERMGAYAHGAKARGLHVIIACAGGSAHLQGMTASECRLPVLAIGPISKTFGPADVLGSTVRMPKGIPLAFMGFDEAGATNAALMAARILAITDKAIDDRLNQHILEQTDAVPYAAHD